MGLSSCPGNTAVSKLCPWLSALLILGQWPPGFVQWRLHSQLLKLRLWFCNSGDWLWGPGVNPKNLPVLNLVVLTQVVQEKYTGWLPVTSFNLITLTKASTSNYSQISTSRPVLFSKNEINSILDPYFRTYKRLRLPFLSVTYLSFIPDVLSAFPGDTTMPRNVSHLFVQQTPTMYLVWG